MKSEIHFMERAIELAKKGIYTTSPNPSVGCVISEGNKILSESFHLRSGSDHAEVIALKKLNKKINSKMNMYVTLEPCCHFGKTGPCTKAIIESGIKNIFISVLDPNPKVKGKGVRELRSHGINVNIGLCRSLSEDINRGFFSRIIRKIPFVIAKQAISMDLKITSPKSKWISSKDSRKDVQYYRAKSCAILVSSKTIKSDNPSLKAKLTKKDLDSKILINQPIRVVLDSNLSLRPDKYKFFCGSDKKIVFNSTKNFFHKEKNIDFVKVKTDKSGLNLKEILKILASRYEINNLFIEPGARLLNTLLSKNLVDELILYKSPDIIGKSGLQSFGNFDQIPKNTNIFVQSLMKLSNDVRIIYKILRK
tara:strand:+ start:1281 stop:2375 length:1095 start_codon:yes stop_codon:yes gene_type:complete